MSAWYFPASPSLFFSGTSPSLVFPVCLPCLFSSHVVLERFSRESSSWLPLRSPLLPSSPFGSSSCFPRVFLRDLRLPRAFSPFLVIIFLRLCDLHPPAPRLSHVFLSLFAWPSRISRASSLCAFFNLDAPQRAFLISLSTLPECHYVFAENVCPLAQRKGNEARLPSLTSTQAGLEGMAAGQFRPPLSANSQVSLPVVVLDRVRCAPAALSRDEEAMLSVALASHQ